MERIKTEDGDSGPQTPINTRLIHVYVGRKRRHYVIHSHLLFPMGDWISRRFQGKIPTEVDFREHDPSTFEILYDWIHTGRLAIETTESQEHHVMRCDSQIQLFKVWALAADCGLPKLEHHCTDLYVHLSELNHHHVNEAVVKLAFSKGPFFPMYATNGCLFKNLMMATAIYGLKNENGPGTESNKDKIFRVMEDVEMAQFTLEELVRSNRNIDILEVYNPSNIDATCGDFCSGSCSSAGLTFKESYLKRLEVASDGKDHSMCSAKIFQST